MKLTPKELDFLLERFDQTEPAMQREIVGDLMVRLHRAERERNCYREIAGARDDLLVCYRLGKHPSEKVFKRLDKAKAELAALDSQQTETTNPNTK